MPENFSQESFNQAGQEKKIEIETEDDKKNNNKEKIEIIKEDLEKGTRVIRFRATPVGEDKVYLMEGEYQRIKSDHNDTKIESWQLIHGSLKKIGLADQEEDQKEIKGEAI